MHIPFYVNLWKRNYHRLEFLEKLIKSLNAEGNMKQADVLSRMIKGKNKALGGKKGKKLEAMVFCFS